MSRTSRRRLQHINVWNAEDLEVVRTVSEEESMPIEVLDLSDMTPAEQFDALLALGRAAFEEERWADATGLLDLASITSDLYTSERVTA